MINKRVRLINQLGLHARAAAKLVQKANEFEADINIAHNNSIVNGKSIIGLLMLAAPKGSELELQISGPDEEKMSQALRQLIENKFGEKA